MHARRLVAPLAVTAAVAAGGVAGALVGVPVVSGAQESDDATDTNDTNDTTTAPDDRPFAGVRFHAGPFDAAADALGIDVDDLLAALRDGRTIAELAEEHGVALDDVIDAMVADVLEHLDQTEAEVRERIAALVERSLPDGPRPHLRFHPGPHHGHLFAPGLDAAADALGMERAELAEALRDGTTIAELAEERGVDVDRVVDAMVADARERISEFVHEGGAHLELRAERDDDPGSPAPDPDADETAARPAA